MNNRNDIDQIISNEPFNSFLSYQLSNILKMKVDIVDIKDEISNIYISFHGLLDEKHKLAKQLISKGSKRENQLKTQIDELLNDNKNKEKNISKLQAEIESLKQHNESSFQLKHINMSGLKTLKPNHQFNTHDINLNQIKKLKEENALLKKEKEENALIVKESSIYKKLNLSLIGENKTLKEKNSSFKEQSTLLFNENESLKKELTSIKEQADLLEKENSSLKKENASINEKVDSSDELNESLRKELAKIQEQVNLLEKENSSLKKENAIIKEKADSLIDENISLKDENSSIKESTDCLIKEKNDSILEYSSIGEENLSLKKDNVLLLNENAKFKKENDHLNKKLIEEKKNALNLKKEKDKLNQVIASIEENNKKLSKQISEKNLDIDRKKSLIEDQQKQIANLSDEIDTLKKTIQKTKKTKKLTNISDPTISCFICNKPINDSDLVLIHDESYHKNCIKCKVCQKTFELPEQLDEIVYINSKLFLCKDHYEEYQKSHDLPAEIEEEYKQEVKENIINLLFDNNQFFPEIENQPSEKVFITDELVKNSYQIHKPYELFVPTVELHFNKSPEEIDYDKLTQEFIDDGLCIINVRKGSTFLKIAFMDLNEGKEKFNQFKNKIISPLGKSVVGNFLNEPEIMVPDENKIKELYKKPSINILQHNFELDEIDIQYIKKEVLKKLNNEKKVNFEFLFSHQDIFDDFEKQLINDIRNNAYEIIVVGETIIANRYLDEYESIKAKISKKNVVENYVYHGSRLANHEKIIKEHFLMPGKDKIEEQTDDGYYGKGVYGTDNLFYASMYGNGYKKLKINEKTFIIVCKAIYNKKKVKQIKDRSYYGKQIDEDIADKYGINQALVGDKNDFWSIKEEEINDNSIVANEFVFPNKYQILPILSLMVMRTDHFILWKDENINDENLRYLEQISKKNDVNFYHAKSYEEAIEIANLKKRNKFKLITNSGIKQNGQKLIKEIRKIVKSNFVCLVFACSMKNIDWVTQMENVLFTNNEEDFKEFSALKLRKNDILKFIKKLEESFSVKFNINKKQLLKFSSARQNE